MPTSPFSEPYVVLRQMLIARRREQGITQIDLAGRLAKPQSFVAKVETGERRLDVVEFCQWVVALGLAPSEVIKEMQAQTGFLAEPGQARPNS